MLKMKKNYHTHTTRCHHANGTEREMIEAAIARGLTTLGFSDHAPQIFSKEYWEDTRRPKIRMSPLEFTEYTATLRALRDEYADRIDIKIGLEAEYYPACFDGLCALVAQEQIDYLLLGQHYLGNEEDEPYSGIASPGDAHVARYFSQTLEGLASGRFTYLAHPDVVRYDRESDTQCRMAEDFCRAVAQMGIPMEINLLGVSEHRHYPTDSFFRIARDAGCRFVIGIDAHAVSAIENLQPEADAWEFCCRNGLTVLEHVELVRPY